MSKYLERTNASKPTFGDYVTLPMKCYGGPNEHFIHEVLSSPFNSNSWREVPIKAGDFEEQLHDTSEPVVAVRAQGVNPRDAHIFAVRLADVLPMKGDKWSWRESPLRSRIAELEGKIDQLTAHSDIERQDDKWIPEVQESEATACKFCGSNESDRRMNSIVCSGCGRKIGNVAPPEVQE